MILLGLVSRTQEVDLEGQLKLGVRALQVQAHLLVFFFFSSAIFHLLTCIIRRGGELHFCHAREWFIRFVVSVLIHLT